MIFFLITAYWIIVASTPEQFLIPACLILIRTCYLSKAVGFPVRNSLLLLVLIFFFTLWGGSLSAAILIILRIGLLILLFGHMRRTPRSRVFAYILSLKLFRPLAYFLHYLERITAMLIKRSSDVQYAVSVRLADGNMAYRKRIALIVRAGVSLVVEVSYIIEHVHLVLVSRGEVPATVKWRQLPPFAWTVPIGDALCFISVFCYAYINSSIFPPELHWLLLTPK